MKFIGTSHISPESIIEVETTIKEYQPDIICIELDKRRLYSLIHNKSNKSRIRFTNISEFVISLIGAYVEKKLGKLVGTKPGDEMKKAIEIANKNKLKLALIDQDIKITLKKLAKIPKREKWKIVKDILFGFFNKKKRIKIDLKKVPPEKFIEQILEETKTQYPSIYNILIKERNQIMAKNLSKLEDNNKEQKILVIIGAGHVKGIKKILSGS